VSGPGHVLIDLGPLLFQARRRKSVKIHAPIPFSWYLVHGLLSTWGQLWFPSNAVSQALGQGSQSVCQNERWTPEHGTDRIVASQIACCLIVPTESLPAESLIGYLGPIPVPSS
jgi:hypothetical protein